MNVFLKWKKVIGYVSVVDLFEQKETCVTVEGECVFLLHDRQMEIKKQIDMNWEKLVYTISE